MIQSILFFSLGFLAASLLALLIAPAIWGRAVALTRKRIEASLPMSLEEMQAEKDRLRAEFAMTARRLEIGEKTARDKASRQAIDLDRAREDIRNIAATLDAREKALSALGESEAKLRDELAQRADDLTKTSDRLAEAHRRIDEDAREAQEMGRLYDEATLTASSRQIDLVARESEVERLAAELSGLRSQRKEAEARAREAAAAMRVAQEELKAERKRAADLERKLERMMTTLANRDEKIERREAELKRARAAAGVSGKAVSAGADAADANSADANSADSGRLEERLATMARENRKLKAKLKAVDAAPVKAVAETGAAGARPESSVLRDQIGALAAEVVNLTARIEGPDSPIERILAESGDTQPGTVPSLAERVRALQKADRS